MKNLKPFDIEEALAGKAVVLRDGRKAYVRHHETELDVTLNYKLLGYLEDGDQRSWCENGDYIYATINDADIIGMYHETRIINGFEVPAPETKKPALDTKYHTPLLTSNCFCCWASWEDDCFDNRALQRGLVFLSEEGAIATAKAMLGIDPRNVRAEE